MTDDERDTFEDDWAITEAISEKHGVSVVTGIYRKAQLDLVREGRKAERHQIVAWLRAVQGLWADEYAAQIEAGDYLK
jgi:hypothetical protein